MKTVAGSISVCEDELSTSRLIDVVRPVQYLEEQVR